MRWSLGAVAASALGFALFGAVRFATSIGDGAPLLAAALICLALGAGFGLAVPSAGRVRVGIWGSTAFWAFLLWAAVLEGSTGGNAFIPVLEAGTLVATTCSGALLGGWARRGVAHRSAEDA